MRRDLTHLASMIALLVLETQALLVPSYPLRTHLRNLFHLPVYHILLSFLSLGILFRVLMGNRLPSVLPGPISKKNLGLHLGLCVVLLLNLNRIGSIISEWSETFQLLAWTALAIGFFGSWVSVLVTPGHLSEWTHKNLAWILPAITGSLILPTVAYAPNRLWLSLAHLTFSATSWILSIFVSDMRAIPEILVIGTSTFSVEIRSGCSGYEGVGLTLAYLGTYLMFRRKALRWPDATLLLLVGLIVTWVANAARIAALVLVGTYYSPVVAEKGFHSQAGWIAFTSICICLIYATERMNLFAKSEEVYKSDGSHFPAWNYLIPYLFLTFLQMVSAAFSSDGDPFYPVRTFIVAPIAIRCSIQLHNEFNRPSWIGPIGGLLTYLIWVGLAGSGDTKTPWPQTQPLQDVWIVTRVLGSSFVIPVIEELAFRGYLLRRLSQSFFEQLNPEKVQGLAIFASSVVFGLLHRDKVAGFAAGVVFCFVYKHGRGLSDCIIAHAVVNALLCIEVLYLGHHWHW